jgi:UDPglucose 6-dehydrogenase
LGYVSNPEFLREGSAVEDWCHTDRIVLGGELRDIDAVAALYADIDTPVVRCDITSAELVKYASNAFLATKISFINEIASLCEITGADVTAVAKAVGMDRRIGGAFMNAGIGYGGSCFPKDTRARLPVDGQRPRLPPAQGRDRGQYAPADAARSGPAAAIPNS